MKTYFERLKELREDRDMMQKEIAAILNIRTNVYQRYEYGERLIPIDKLVALADYYGVSTDYILGRTDNRDFTLCNCKPCVRNISDIEN